MRRRYSIFIFLILGMAALPICTAAQVVGADGTPLFSKHNDDDRPKSFKEGVEKMRIEKEKKEHQEMVSRGEDAAKLGEDIQASFERSGSLSRDDLDKLGKLEKLVKKVRDDLGGDDDDSKPDDVDDGVQDDPVPLSLPAAVDALKKKTEELSDLLKQTTRFTISAAAIRSTNNVLKITRALRSRQ
jgi:hypothetical protein